MNKNIGNKILQRYASMYLQVGACITSLMTIAGSYSFKIIRRLCGSPGCTFYYINLWFCMHKGVADHYN